MPLIFNVSPIKDCQIMIWEISESEDFFKNGLTKKNYLMDEYLSITHPHKQLEWLASRFLAKYLAESIGINYNGLIKDAYNKPYLHNNKEHLSLSHTLTHVAAAIHFHQPIGIDLEKITDRLHIIKHKFLTETERENADDDLEKLCIYWSAKESLYKLYGKRGVHFRNELLVSAFAKNDEVLIGKIVRPDLKEDFTIYKYKIGNAYLTAAF